MIELRWYIKLDGTQTLQHRDTTDDWWESGWKDVPVTKE